MTTELVPKTITPSEVFVPHGLDPILAGVRARVEDFKKDNLDMEKEKDRDKLRTFSADIARSKTFVDKARIEFVRIEKDALKVIDRECKTFRDTMDEIRDDTRGPLTTWEDAEKIRIEEERQFEIYLIEWDDALAEDDIFNREKILKEKEAKIARAEEEKRQKEKEVFAKKEQAEREERLIKEAANKVKLEVKEKIQDAKIKRITDLGLVYDGQQWKNDIAHVAVIDLQTLSDNDFDTLIGKIKKVLDERDKDNAERARIAAKEKADKDKQAAIQKAKDDAKEETQRKEQQRLDRKKAEADKIAKEKDISDKKAANLNHQKAVNRRIISAFTILGISEKDGRKIIRAIVREEMPNIFIKY